MSAEDDWWGDAVAAVPGPNDEPMTVPDIRARFPAPRPPLDWLTRHLGALEESGDVEMFALGSLGMSNVGRWLHYRWTRRFFEQMGFDA